MDYSFYYFLNKWEKGDGPIIFWLCFCFLFVKRFKFCYFAIVSKRGNEIDRLTRSVIGEAKTGELSFRNLPVRLSILAFLEGFSYY